MNYLQWQKSADLSVLKKVLPLLLVLLLAFALRIYRLTDVPPGLTHDEANHGREALGILDGVLLFYFPLNYGSEPLYSYTVAGSMLLLGKNLLSLRLVNAIFGMATVSVTYMWAARFFNRRIALWAAALMAVSFWPLAASRQALRAGMLPFFVTGAVWFFWRILTVAEGEEPQPHSYTWPVIGFAICLALTLHIYLSARVAWLMFPAFVLYLALVRRPLFRRAWLPALMGLLLTGLMVVPMFVYLQNHPEALTRLDMLDRPLQELQAGNFGPMLKNSSDALLAFVWPGYGDTFLAYNIPGRPVFTAVTAVFFVSGIIVCLWRWRQPAFAFVLVWFVSGIIPSLITGATANTTRNLAALSAVYLLPAIGFTVVADRLVPQQRQNARLAVIVAASAWILFAGGVTVRDYFVRWGQSPEVRSAYQHTLIEALAYLEQQVASGDGPVEIDSPVVISSVYPGPVHDPSIARVMLPQPDLELRWVDARYALLLPHNQDAHALIPASTPRHPAFALYLQSVESVVLRADDLDPGFTFYVLDADWSSQMGQEGQNGANFDGAVTLLQAQWLAPTVQPGETAELMTIWRVIEPARVGPVVPPAYTTDVSLFTHVLDETGQIVGQRDALDAPSWDWQPGDIILQIHPVSVPAETAPGSYRTAVGIYDRASGQRRPVVNEQGEIVDDRAFVTPLQVVRH